MEKFKNYLKNKKFEIKIEKDSYSNIYFSAWNKSIRVEGYSLDEGYTWRFGIDPKSVFDKTSKCSVIVHFPLSNREKKRFYKFLDKITNIKDNTYKEWIKDASTSFCGEFAEFGI